MKLDVHIAPIGNFEGMAVYSCPKCDRLQNEFIPPAANIRRQEGR
jgi:hypothetical protein